MPRYEDEPTQRCHIVLYRRDVERLQQIYGPNIGFSKAVRIMIRKFLDQIEAKATKDARHPTIPEFTLDSTESGEP